MNPCTDISNELLLKQEQNGNETLTGKKSNNK